MKNRKLLLIGWDAADWKIINPMLDEGLMPTLNKFVNEGVMGNLASLQPMLSPMLWTSIATGKRPEKHGIHGFTEPDPHTAGVRPVTSTSRKAKAIWNILTQQGMKAHAVGWFASHPAEPINGVCVSELFPMTSRGLTEAWPLADGAVYPEKLRERFAGFRMHPEEVREEAILPFIPKAASIDQNKDWRLAAFVKVLAENCSVHNCATWILENEEWNFAAFYYNGIDHFCHAFMGFHPPRREHVPEEMFELYRHVVVGAYRFHDMMLDRLLRLTPPDATVMLVSDHGFYSDHLRPPGIPTDPAGPTVQHRPLGVFAMRGPGVLSDERIYGATLLDITPTILSVFGLPVGQDMDGRVLVQAFETPPEIKTVSSWESIPGDSGMHPADIRMDAESAQALIDQFVALGYVEQEEDKQQAVKKSVRELRYNRARALMDERKPSSALPLFEALSEEWPKERRFKEYLARCYFQAGRREEAKALLVQLLAENERPLAVRDQTRAETQAEQIGGKSEETWVDRPSAVQARADWLMGLVLFEEGDKDAALTHLLRAEAAEPLLPNLHILLGNTYLRVGRLTDAKRAFSRALEIDVESPEAYLGMARCCLRSKENQDAVENALAALGLLHFMPVGHLVLGIALARLGHFDRAVVALETALSMAPGLLNAHRVLVAIHSRPEGDKRKAGLHKDLAVQLAAQRSTLARGARRQ